VTLRGLVVLQAGYDVSLMHGGETTQSALSEPLHVAIAGRDVPDYDIVELLIDAGLSLECKVLTASSLRCMCVRLTDRLKFHGSSFRVASS